MMLSLRFATSLLFLALGAIAMFLVIENRFVSEISQTLMFVSGLFTMGFLTSLSQITRMQPKFDRMEYDPSIARLSLEEVIPAEYVEIEQRELKYSAKELFLDDPELALAKLRMDIERALRSATESKGTSAKVSLHAMIRDLERQGAVAPPVAHVLSDIMPTLNRAVHGEKISEELASDVFDLGSELLLYLRNLPLQKD